VRYHRGKKPREVRDGIRPRQSGRDGASAACLDHGQRRKGLASVERADWGVLDRLDEKGYISNAQSKSKSVIVTEEGAKRARELFERRFGIERQSAGRR